MNESADRAPTNETYVVGKLEITEAGS